MRVEILSIFAIFVLVGLTTASYCTRGGGVPNGTPNKYTINPGKSNTKLVGTVPNGKLYQVTVPHEGGNTTSTFNLVHLWGPGYNAGLAFGQLFKSTLNATLTDVWTFLKNEVETELEKYVPQWLADMVAEFGLEVALDMTYELTVNYTNTYVYEEIRGMSDGSGVDFLTLRRVNQVAGLTEGKCSMFGSWGSSSLNSHTIQLRALDWETEAPFANNPLVTVYHANDTSSNSYVTVGIPGLVGALTGVSDRQLGISEIGVSYPDASFGNESRVGVPFLFLLRDILHYDNTVDDATNRMINSKRTCDLILGVGDGKLGTFRGYQHSSSVLNVFDDMNLMPNASWHPKIPNVVYWGMDWICPGYSTALANQLNVSLGRITPELAIQNITAVETSGDLHIAYYDLTAMTFYVSFHKNTTTVGLDNAYDRQFTKFDLKELFAEKQIQIEEKNKQN
eukprot:PhF_6_TR14275/c0_g1_i2/m.22959